MVSYNWGEFGFQPGAAFMLPYCSKVSFGTALLFVSLLKWWYRPLTRFRRYAYRETQLWVFTATSCETHPSALLAALLLSQITPAWVRRPHCGQTCRVSAANLWLLLPREGIPFHFEGSGWSLEPPWYWWVWPCRCRWRFQLSRWMTDFVVQCLLEPVHYLSKLKASSISCFRLTKGIP